MRFYDLESYKKDVTIHLASIPRLNPKSMEDMGGEMIEKSSSVTDAPKDFLNVFQPSR